ncbi:MAG: hypothetical protein NT069_26450 [Planctomycetota bacterium]|nr:hypothetical protein [Planctomycetota bacterium]
MTHSRILTLLWLVLVSVPLASADEPASLAKSLTFHAGFDGGVDAGFALGDRRLHTASKLPPTDGKPGNHRKDAVIVPNGGRYGDALRFEKNGQGVIYFPAAKNIDWRPDDWSGTLSLWIKLTPEEDLQPGFADPIQITDKKWDDASFFFDFSKDEKPRHFRFGVFSDLKVWNPKNTPFEQIPVFDRPMIVVEKPPFRRDRWTHVVATWSHYNTGRDDAEARMYLDGKLHGRLKGKQTLGWDPEKTAILLGLSYIGDLDDLALFNRALSDEEVRTLSGLPGGVADLLK